jgi:ABC-type branched-subunit amino acid transport system substrate-binding protein
MKSWIGILRASGSLASTAGFATAIFLATSPAFAAGAKIGALIPLTGGLAQYGESSLNGVKLAIKHINAQGGVLGGKLLLAVGDTKTNAQSGVAAAKQLVSLQGVSGIIGALSSGVTIPVATSVSSVEGVPQISNASTAPGISTLNDKDFMFRTVAHDALQGVVLGDIVKKRGISKVSIIYVNNDYGKGLAEAFSKRFKEIGGTITSSVAYEEKQASYRGELAKAAKGGPQALVQIAYPGDGTPMLKQALEEGFFSKFVFTDGMKSTDMIKAIGAKHLNGSIGTAPEARADSPAAARFRDAYKKEYGKLPPLPFIDSAYDAAFLMALAIEKAGSTNGAKVRDALRKVAGPPGTQILPGEWRKAKAAIAKGQNVNYQGGAGSQDFDSAGDVPGTYGIWTIDSGKIKTLEIVEPKM